MLSNVPKGMAMKKTYEKPKLVRRDNIRRVTAQENGTGSARFAT